MFIYLQSVAKTPARRKRAREYCSGQTYCLEWGSSRLSCHAPTVDDSSSPASYCRHGCMVTGVIHRVNNEAALLCCSTYECYDMEQTSFYICVYGYQRIPFVVVVIIHYINFVMVITIGFQYWQSAFLFVQTSVFDITMELTPKYKQKIWGYIDVSY